jgi:DNA polymerase-3 subunit alpha
VPPWSHTESSPFEKELLGFYVTGHPLDEYRPLLEGGKFTPIAKLAEQEDKSTVSVAGALISVEKKFTKKDSKPFAVVVIEDLTDHLEVMIWSETFAKSVASLEQGNVVAITGRLDLREEGPRISANEVKPLKKPAPRERPLILKFDRRNTTEADLEFVRDTLTRQPGQRRVELVFVGEDGRRIRLLPNADFGVTWNDELKARLAPWAQP